MWIFLLVVAIYSAVLVAWRPAPASLKSAPLTIFENLSKIKMTLLVGIILCGVHFLTTDFSFWDTKQAWLEMLGINNITSFQWHWFPTIITNTFVHHNFVHFLTNLSGIALCSFYERRVGPQRYLAIFIIAGLGSNLSLFAYSEPTIIVGVSGVVFGLAAAYFTDHKDMSLKDWLGALAAFIVLAVFVEFDSAMKLSKSNPDLIVDHFGHVLGAVSAIVYCRLFPKRAEQKAKP